MASAGVAAGARQWPPKPITESGQPKPEDDQRTTRAGEGHFVYHEELSSHCSTGEQALLSAAHCTY